MRGLQLHLVFPYLMVIAMLMLSIMGFVQWVWDCVDPSQRNRCTWISRASDLVMSVAYAGALLSIPTIYYDAWRAGTPGPHTSYTAQTVLFIFALSLSAVVVQVSVIVAMRLWRETKALPMKSRAIRSIGAFFFPFLIPDSHNGRITEKQPCLIRHQ
jgi:hypothetical protein